MSGTCQRLPTEALAAPAAEAGGPPTFTIDLLEAGSLVVAAATSQQQVAPREFPDLFPTVSGVVYGESLRHPGEDGPEAALEVTVEGGGGADVGPFSVQLPLPARPELRSVDGMPPVGGRFLLGRPFGGPLEIDWDADDAGDPDFVLVELEGEGWGTVCRAERRGHFTVPAAALRVADPVQSVVVRVRSITVRPFTAAGIREGEVVGIVEHEGLIVPTTAE